MREFWIKNGKNNITYLAQESSKVYLNNPTGLGYSNAITTNQYADALNLVSEAQNFATIGGEIVFWDDANSNRYTKYNSFITFLQEEPLTFYYKIPTSTPKTYSMSVAVLNIDKTESKEDGLMRCTFSLLGLSRWMGDEVTVTGGIGVTSFTLTNDGHMPVGFTIKVTGAGLSNPYITLTQDGEMYGEAKFISSSTFRYIYVDSKDGEQSLTLREQDGVDLPNPMSYQDLSISNGSIYVTFIKLARGTSTLAIGKDAGSVSSTEIKFIPLYRSV